VAPRELFFAPVKAVRRVMEKEGKAIGDYDLIEANEAFAVQALADGRELGWDWDRVNVHGGAVALGPPHRRVGRPRPRDAAARHAGARRADGSGDALPRRR
jgi:acetyl-CoA acetyltransferase